MVTFQQPFDIVGMRRQQMLESQNDQEMQQRNQALLVGALGDLAGMYQQQEQMKAGVKSGEQMLKMFGPQLGVDSKILSSPEYKAMGLQGQSAMHGNLWGSLGAISQLRMAGMRAEQMPVMQAQKVTDQRDIMYEREQLARERQMMSSPPAPAAITVPPAMRRFGNPNNP
jgi:hypothetical protein